MIGMATQPQVNSVAHVDFADELVTGEAVALDLRPASFVLRAAGTMIDYLVYVLAFVGGMLLMSYIVMQLQLDPALFTALSIVTFVVCLVVAPTVVETLSSGRSLGKLAIGARIVRDDGGAIGLRHAFIRALVAVLEIVMTAGSIAAITALLNGRSKRLGDLLAGTYSQNERVSKHSPAVFGVPAQLLQWAKTADVAKMPDGLARRVSTFLGQSGGLTPQTRAGLSRQLATEVSVFVSPIPQVDAELFLAAVVALRRDREFRALQLERRGLDRLAPVLGGVPHNFPER